MDSSFWFERASCYLSCCPNYRCDFDWFVIVRCAFPPLASTTLLCSGYGVRDKQCGSIYRCGKCRRWGRWWVTRKIRLQITTWRYILFYLNNFNQSLCLVCTSSRQMSDRCVPHGLGGGGAKGMFNVATASLVSSINSQIALVPLSAWVRHQSRCTPLLIFPASVLRTWFRR